MTKRIFWLVLIGYLLVTAYFVGWTYYRSCDQAERSNLFRLEGIANAVALQIDADVHTHIVAKYGTKDAILFNAQDTNYYKIHYVLARNAVANMLKTPVYTMVFDSTKQYFEFIGTSADTPYFRHEYRSFKPILKEKYTEGGLISMYNDEFGTWLSAFSPIRDRLGRPIGVVMVDEQFDKFITRARMAAVQNLLVSLFIILPIILLLIYWLRRMLSREERLKDKLEKAYKTNLKISRELEVSYEKLASINTLRKEMIANISHDLRTPLTNLSGYIETLFMRRHDISMAERERFLTIAQKESQRLKKLIDDLFELSKLESNQIELKTEPFPIAELLQDIVAKYEIVCTEKGLTITTHFSENLPWVVADIKLIDRVLQNLFDNAIRYNQPSGCIDLNLQRNDCQLVIKISNTGETIPSSVLSQIFDRYFKNSEVEGSTGLGLAIVKKIMDLHQCPISVDSTEGVTSFTFSLPIYNYLTSSKS
ncbi:MAG: HAMP domain-containing histidine kinase [Saprospiraceae bacterium]|nr:HAMP domain-containing histidine kinase [Saprospiraceae bacterium]